MQNYPSTRRPEHGAYSQYSLDDLLSVDLWQVTTKGVKHIARGCANLAVLNLYHCNRVQVRVVAPISSLSVRLVPQ